MKRRGFMHLSAGAGAATLLGSSTARAADEPKRLVVIYTPDGTIHNKWRPTGNGNDFTLPEILSPFEDQGLRDDLLVLDGVKRVTPGGDGDGHEKGMTQMLTARPNTKTSARAGGISIDEYINQNIGGGRPTLRLGVRAQNYASNWTRMCYDNNGNPLHPENNPTAARNDIFEGFNPDGNGPSPEEIRRRYIRERVLSYSERRVSELKSNAGAADARRYDTHGQSLQSLLNQPVNDSSLTCSLDKVNGWGSLDHKKNSNVPEIASRQMDLIAAAFACDRARVASIQFSQSNSKLTHGWAGANASHHGLSHRSDGYKDPFRTDALVKIYKWYANQIAAFARNLKDEGLLSNTVILWASEMGDGERHTNFDIPYVIIGGANHFVTGQYKDYRNQDGKFIPNEKGVSHADVHVSLCNAMGMSDTSFGEAKSCFGPLKGVT